MKYGADIVVNKLQLFLYPEVHNAIINAVKLFRDPLKSDNPLLYEGNVKKSLPGRDKVSLYKNVLGHVSLDDVPTVLDGGSGEEVATITGQLYTWIAGRDDLAIEKCQRYCDITRAYFKNHDLLDIPGTFMTVPKSYVNRFTKINLSEVARKPIYYVVGSTGFIVEKDLDTTVYTL